MLYFRFIHSDWEIDYLPGKLLQDILLTKARAICIDISLLPALQRSCLDSGIGHDNDA